MNYVHPECVQEVFKAINLHRCRFQLHAYPLGNRTRFNKLLTINPVLSAVSSSLRQWSLLATVGEETTGSVGSLTCMLAYRWMKLSLWSRRGSYARLIVLNPVQLAQRTARG